MFHRILLVLAVFFGILFIVSPAGAQTPALYIIDQSGPEGAIIQVSVGLSMPTGLTVTVDYMTHGGTAVSPDDYDDLSGTLTFIPGDTLEYIYVSTWDDSIDEADEAFTANLENPVNAVIGDNQAIVTLQDGDPLPLLSFATFTDEEGTGGATTFAIDVTLTPASGRTVTVNYGTSGGSATPGADYTPVSGMLTFVPGDTLETVMVSINPDIIDEPLEDFYVNFSSPVNATMGASSALVRIVDDDLMPTITINDVSLTEGNSGSVGMQFTISLSAPSGYTVTVQYATAPGTAMPGSDYQSVGTITGFSPGVTSATVMVPIMGDLIDEFDETFTVVLSAPANAAIADPSGLGTILDNDDPPSVSVNDSSTSEGTGGSKNLTFTVALSLASGKPVSVNYATSNGSAIAGFDYTALSGTLTFTPGATSQPLNVALNTDSLDEDNETFQMTLSAPVNAILGDSSGTGTITDDDNPPTVNINDVTVAEGTGGSTTANFTASLSTPSGKTISVNYGTSGGSAVSGVDFTAAAGTLTFSPGVTSQPIPVSITTDALDEDSEDFTVTLSGPVNVTLGHTNGAGTITDDDLPPSVGVHDVTVTEGTGGSTTAVFMVGLSAPSGKTATVNYFTSSGTAFMGEDFTSAAGTLTFNPGVISQPVNVAIVTDGMDEFDETFTLSLAAPVNASLGDPNGIGTITDDDLPPLVSINDVTVVEGTGGTTNANFNVTLSQPSAKSASVVFTTAPGTATAGADFIGVTGAVAFAPGHTSEWVQVGIVTDNVDELDEAFSVNLSAPVNTTIADGVGIGTITDDDEMPVISIFDADLVEGNSGIGLMQFNLELSHPSSFAITVDADTLPITATGDIDFELTFVPAFFPPMETKVPVFVPIFGDLMDELDETFDLKLGNPVNAVLGDISGLGTILDDDAPPAVSISNSEVTEGTGGVTTANFTLTLSQASGLPVSVVATTVAGSALEGDDYSPVFGLTISFPPGSTSQMFGVGIVPDVLDELDEVFTVVLSAPANATIGDGSGDGVIFDDDDTPTLSIADAGLTEGDAGMQTMTFTVTLSAASGLPVLVNYEMLEGTATEGLDFIAAAGPLDFVPGVTTLPIDVQIFGDLLDEPSETFTVLLTDPLNALVSDGEATGTIHDNDATVVELLRNNGFEAGPRAGTLLPWTVTYAIGTLHNDKVKCGALGYNGSDCAFVFKGGALENTVLKQTVKGAGLPILLIGDQIEFRLAYSTTMLKPKLSAKAKLIFSDGSVLTLKPLLPFATTSGYTLATSGPQTLTQADVVRVKIILTHTSTKGTLLVDEIHLDATRD